MAHSRCPIGTEDFAPFDFAPEDPIDAYSWEDRPSRGPFRTSSSNCMHARPGVSSPSDLPSLRSQSGFSFDFAPRPGVNSLDILQSSFETYFPDSSPASSAYLNRPIASSKRPIESFLNDGNGPWAFLSSTLPSQTQKAPETPYPQRLPFGRPAYRSNPQSEVDSIATNHWASDSGYQSRTAATRSEKSGEFGDCRSEISTSIARQFESLHPYSAMPSTTPGASSDKTEDRTSKSLSSPRGGQRTCERCQKTLKCPSDYKKHMLKHDKPHRCTVPTCSRAEGFITVNDLKRHQKSVHKVGVDTISFKCASPHCKTPDKIWPRLDNFRQHIIRMHKKENTEVLIPRSEVRSPAGVDSSSNNSMERDLAGIAGVSKYTVQLTVHPDDLRMSSTSRITHSAVDTLDLPQNPPTPYSAPNPNSGPRQTSNWHGDGGLRAASIKSLSSTLVEPHASLTLLANVSALASPSSSVLQSSYAYSPGSSSNFVASPDKSMSSDDQKLIEGTNLSESLKAVAKELGSASDEVKDRVIKALLSKNNQSMAVRTKSNGRSPQSTRSLSDDGRWHTPYDRYPSDGHDGHDGRDDKSESSCEHEEVRKGLVFIASIGSKQAQMGLGSPTNVTKAKAGGSIICEDCNKVLPRACDYRKHKKRHTRPFACVWPDCWKKFGSKNDWIRHECGQHFYDKFWLCHRLDASKRFGRCSEAFNNLDYFAKHLKVAHSLEEREMKNTIEESTVGLQGQPRFWCGFCKKNCWRGTSLATKFDPKKAPSEDRFNHIIEHFKAGERVEDWVHWKTLLTKREMAGTQAHNDSGETPQRPSVGVDVPDVVVIGERSERSKKRKSCEGRSPEREVFWECCECNAGPLNAKLHADCSSFSPECNHKQCPQCRLSSNHKVAKLQG